MTGYGQFSYARSVALEDSNPILVLWKPFTCFTTARRGPVAVGSINVDIILEITLSRRPSCEGRL